MIRIVGVQRSEWPEREFVLLQNQGNLRLQLRGLAVVSDEAFSGAPLEGRAHAFSDEAWVPPGAYVMLHTGLGEPQWRKTKDHAMVFHAFANRELPLWSETEGPLHVLAKQHTYAPPRDVLVLR